MGATVRLWYEREPERLEWELEQLEAGGWDFSPDQEALGGGRIILRGSVQCDDGERSLAIVFPFTYPEHRVEIYDLTGDEALLLHQNPYQRNLCLLDNLPRAWTPTDSAAMMVQRVLELRKAARDGVKALERIGVGAPEPRSAYYPYVDNSSVLITENLCSISGDWGWFRFKTVAPDDYLRGVVSRIGARAPSRFDIEAPIPVVNLFSGRELRGAWMRIAHPPPWLNTAEEFKEWAICNIAEFKKVLKDQGEASREFQPLEITPFALVYPDQGPAGLHDTWLTCLLISRRTRSKLEQTTGVLLRPFILAAEDQHARIRSIARLNGKRVAVIGLGTVGAPIALELARTGLLDEMLLVDYDYYSVGNIVRHPLDLRALGLNKADALASEIRACAPSLKLTLFKVRLGQTPPPQLRGQSVEAELLGQLKRFDLLIDATADSGTSRFLNRFSLSKEIPLIVASVTEGGWGGEVIRSIPGETGCYECYEWWMKDRTIAPPSQEPEAIPVFTRGCGYPTFTGTGFDAVSLAADATRLAVQTLVRREPGAYPNAAYDAVIRNNRGAASDEQFPGYAVHKVPVHPECGWHTGNPL